MSFFPQKRKHSIVCLNYHFKRVGEVIIVHFVKDMLECVLVEIDIKIDTSFLCKWSQIFNYWWLNCLKNHENY